MKISIFITILLFTSLSVSASGRVSEWSPYRLGLRVQMDADRLGRVAISLDKNSTYKNDLVLPPLEQRFECALYDENGKEMSKTDKGKKQGSLLDTKMSRHFRISRQVRLPPDNSPMPAGFLDLSELFKIGKEGDYELKLTVRLLKEDGDNLLPVTYPSIKLNIHLP